MLSKMKDWQKSQQRWEAFWHQEIVDRPLISASSRLNEDISSILVPANNEIRWLDEDFRIKEAIWDIEHTYYAADGFPMINTSIGPGTLAVYLGAQPEFGEDTVWYHKSIDDISNVQIPKLDLENKYWQDTLRLLKKSKEQLAGKALLGIPDLIENIDVISSMVGNVETLFALMECPEKIHEFQKAILPLYFEYYDRILDIIAEDDGGVAFSHFGVYAKGRMAKVQCDFSAMISSEMFGEFVSPYLKEQCDKLDYSLYHWDGLNALQHEEHLLSIRSLTGIQFTPGAGHENPVHPRFYDLWKRVKAAGKSGMLWGTPKEIEDFAAECGARGFLLVTDFDTPEEADAFVKSSYNWNMS